MSKGLIFFDWTAATDLKFPSGGGWGVSFTDNEDETFGYCPGDPDYWNDWDLSILKLPPEAEIRVKRLIASAWTLSHVADLEKACRTLR